MAKKKNKGFFISPISRVLSAIFGRSFSHYNHEVSDFVDSKGNKDGLTPAEKQKIAELITAQHAEATRKVSEVLALLGQ